MGLFGQSKCANKLEAQTQTKTVECVFLGYIVHNIGYRFLIINYGVPDMHVGNIIESRDATFFESEFPLKSAPNFLVMNL